MANFAYIPPGVSVTEQVTSSVQTLLDRPTSIAIVGETLGFLSYAETLQLDDISPVRLKQSGIDTTTLVVADGINPTVIYGPTDYVLSAADAFGNRTLRRNLYTSIPTQTEVAVVFTQSGAPNIVTTVATWPGFSPLTGTDTITITATNGNITAAVIQVEGRFTSISDYTATPTSSTYTLARQGGGAIVDGQKVYVTYTTASGANSYVNEGVTLPGTTAVHLVHEAEDVDTASVIVTNSPSGIAADLPSGVTPYNIGPTNDYNFSSGSAFGTATVSFDRMLSGPSTIGIANNSASVRVTYQATPVTYYQPTRFFSQGDVESIYGSALTASGSINSPASLAAYLAFVNGASDVVIQPLFHVADSSDVSTTRTRTTPATYSNDWDAALHSLRELEDINVIVPIISKTVSSGTITDSLVGTIESKVMAHVYFMFLNQQHIIALFGEDSTVAGNATQATLQLHARVNVGSASLPERGVLVSPGSFAFPLPSGNGAIRVGGQFVAAAAAGMLAARPIQMPLTRKNVLGITDVLDFRTEMDKNSDASSGLFVVENKRGTIRVRHSITTAVNDINTVELSVIRAKLFMMESIRATLDALIGNLIDDSSASFTVSTAIQGVLDALVGSGAITDYAGIQTSVTPERPTTLTVRFSWKPAFPLNYINVEFSIDTSSGSIVTADLSS